MDSNHRSETQQIYSLPPLATREPLHIRFSCPHCDDLTSIPRFFEIVNNFFQKNLIFFILTLKLHGIGCRRGFRGQGRLTVEFHLYKLSMERFKRGLFFYSFFTDLQKKELTTIRFRGKI